ncbi:MAG: hypothetical protein HUJ68_00245 [Clostridia bacterium]|nr:hypothetical protein [Clostridia bacterium]
MLFCGTVNIIPKTVLAEELTTPEHPIDEDEYQDVPVYTSTSVMNLDSRGLLATCFVRITGSFVRTDNAVTNVNLYYDYFSDRDYCTITNFRSSYTSVGNTLYVTVTVTMRLTLDGVTTYVTGSSTEAL